METPATGVILAAPSEPAIAGSNPAALPSQTTSEILQSSVPGQFTHRNQTPEPQVDEDTEDEAPGTPGYVARQSLQEATPTGSPLAEPLAHATPSAVVSSRMQQVNTASTTSAPTHANGATSTNRTGDSQREASTEVAHATGSVAEDVLAKKEAAQIQAANKSRALREELSAAEAFPDLYGLRRSVSCNLRLF